MKPPVLYFGAKGRIADQIVELLPAHAGYIEPFAGSLAVLLAKPPVKIEVVNDLDRDLFTFWKVLRDRPDELVRAAALTPHSRAELELAQDRDDLDELEWARRVWVSLTQGRGSSLRYGTGFRTFYDPAGTNASMATYMDSYRDRLAPAAARIQGVTLECRDALGVIDDYGRYESNLLYVDPPYLYDARSGGSSPRYRHEFSSVAEHERMAERLHACRSAVVLSGYHSETYDRLFSDWHVHEIGARSDNAIDRERVEVLWSNRPFGGERLW